MRITQTSTLSIALGHSNIFFIIIYLFTETKKDLSEYMYCYKCDSYICFISQRRLRFRDQKVFFALRGNFHLTRQFGLNIGNVKTILN